MSIASVASVLPRYIDVYGRILRLFWACGISQAKNRLSILPYTSIYRAYYCYLSYPMTSVFDDLNTNS